MIKIFKNTTLSDIELQEIGITVLASSQYTLNTEEYAKSAGIDSITEISPYITSGDIVINDGVDDITVANGFILQEAIDYISSPVFAGHIRFAAEPERSNGYTKKNVQEAIEQTRTSGIGKILNFFFGGNGNVANKWLGYGNSSSASDIVPLVLPQNSDFKGITYVNENNNSSTNLEVYKNGVLLSIIEIRNKRWAYIAGISGTSFSQGDRISVFFRKVTGGGFINPAVPEVTLIFKLTNEVAATGGAQNGV